MKCPTHSKRRLLAVAFSIVSLTAFVGCKHRSPEARATKIVEKITDKLDLNAAQQADLEKLKAEALADFKAMHPDRRAGADLLEKQLTAATVDRAALKQYAATQSSKRDVMVTKWIDKLAGFYETLAPAQKTEALKQFQKFRSKFEKHHD